MYERFNAGDAELAVRRLADDAHLVLHGDHPLAADVQTKAQVAGWLRRLMTLGLEWEIRDVVVQGTPWSTRLVTRYRVHTPPRRGGSRLIYEGAQYARLRWGRILMDDILPDTQAVAAYFSTAAAPTEFTPG